MTEEAIKARMEVLNKDLQTIQQNYYAIVGAIQDCEYWLKQLNTKESD